MQLSVPAPTQAVIDTDPDPAKLTTWQKNKALAFDLSTQQIPDSTVIHTTSQPSTVAKWAEISVCTE
jgi:hypothetical protein